MKLATFTLAGRPKIGIVHGGSRVFDLAQASQLEGRIDSDFESMLSLIDAGPRSLDRATRLFERREQEQNSVCVAIRRAALGSGTEAEADAGRDDFPGSYPPSARRNAEAGGAAPGRRTIDGDTAA